MSNRPYGVEIEFYADVKEVEKEYYDHYYGRRMTHWTDNWDEVEGTLCKRLPKWEVKGDGSLSDYGFEIASPVMTDFRELAKATKVLESVGAYADYDCGLHVHFDVSDYTPDDIYRLLESWTNNHEAINYMVDRSRWENDYCVPWEEEEVKWFVEESKNYGGFSHDRYRSLNLNNYNYRKTIEIRYHEGTVNYDEIKAWVLFCRSFVNSVKKRKRPIVRSNAKRLMSVTKTYAHSQRILNKKMETLYGVQTVR